MTPTRPAIQVLALLAPLVIVGSTTLTVLAHDQPLARKERRARANAGHILNGERVSGGVVEEIEASLADRRPEVLILGNSIANTNIDAELLASNLDLDPSQVLVVSIPNSVAPHWYAVLKNRVYANGHRPRLVLILASLHSMLLTRPYSEAGLQNLEVQLAEDEPLLDQYVPRRDPTVALLQRNRRSLHDQALRSWRNLVVTTICGDGDPAHVDDAIARVFAPGDADRTVAPLGLIAEPPTPLPALAELPPVQASLLPALVDLTAAHGSRLVLVRSPQAPRVRDEVRDDVPWDTEDDVARLMDESGNRFVDVYGLEVPRRHYFDPHHMTPYAARILTRTIAPEIAEIWSTTTPR